MRSDNGTTTSVWMETESTPRFPKLDQNITTDVCIVGAGIAGLSVAYELSKAGKKVVVLDDGPIAGGETCRTTAHLVSAIDDRLFEIERLHTKDGAKLAAESHAKAIDRIEEIVRAENIDCDFKRLDGFLFLSKGDSPDILDKELAAYHRAGFTDVEKLDRAPLINFETGPCLRFPNQGQFHILKYLNALIKVIEANGGMIFANTHMDSVEAKNELEATVKCGDNEIKAQSVVVATNTPVNDWVEMHTKQMPYRTYVVAAKVPRGSVKEALYWDTGDPYHYIRLQDSDDANYQFLIVGGEDHKTGQANDGEARFACLEEWARARWPQIAEDGFTMRWSGQVMETQDGLGFIGRNPMDKPNVYIATGDSGMGMTHGTIAGMLISDLILGRENPWEKLYDPKRIRIMAAGEWIKENVNTFAQYTEHLTPGDVPNETQIARGEGAVIRRGTQKIAVYCDEQGQTHECSAVCPHLFAVVQWNPTEKTWDCPAHGSRFTPDGQKVINGPANGGLGPVKEEEKKDAA